LLKSILEVGVLVLKLWIERFASAFVNPKVWRVNGKSIPCCFLGSICFWLDMMAV
jgi:hypothetical protein